MLSCASSDAARTQNEQALAAATVAFVRAHAGDTAERANKQSTELSRTKSNASRKSQGSHLQGMLFPPRQPNFRSIQPRKTAQVALVRRQSYAPPEDTEKFPNFYVTPDKPDAAMSSPPSMMLDENVRPSSQPKMLRPSASLSVASQQIRKARSMYYASSIQTGSPLPRPPAKYLTTPPTISPEPDNSLLSSRSVGGYFQRPRSSIIPPLASPQLPLTVIPDEGVSKARDRCLQDFQQQRQPKHKPSLFLGPFKKRQDKSKISSSVGTFAFGNERTPVDPPLDTLNRLGSKKGKRTISNSLKHKIKKAFRRVSKPQVPSQQVVANRNYLSSYASNGDTSPAMWTSQAIPTSGGETLRHSSRTPSLEVAHAGLMRPCSRDSNRSGHSAPSNRSQYCEAGAASNSAASRVTSWGSSSAGGTLTQRDIKRLTVIHETKDSLGSELERSVAPRSPKRKPPPIPGLAAFREPMPIDSLMEEATTPIDPKRVFSALMREIDASKSSPTKLSSHPSSEGDVFVSGAAGRQSLCADREHRPSCSRGVRSIGSCDPVRPSSFRHPGSLSAQSNLESQKSHSLTSPGRALEATIRSVTPSEMLPNKTLPPERTTSVRGPVRILRPGTASSKSTAVSTDEEDSSSRNHKLSSIQTPNKPHVPPGFQSENIFTPTIEQSQVQRKQRNETTALACPHITSEACSVENIARKTLLRRLSDDPHPSKLFAETEKRQIQIERPPPASPLSPKSNHQSIFSPLSPSVYSRNTDGISILPNDSVMSFDGTAERDHSGTGSAVIITSHAVQSYTVGSPKIQREINSVHSSRDWKVWLSHEVSELENSSLGEVSIQEQYRTPTSPLVAVRESDTPTGHHREFTQIADVGATMVLHEIESSPQSMLVQQSAERETPNIQSIPAELAASRKPSQKSFMSPESQDDSQTRTSRDTSAGFRARPNTKQQRVSSIQNSGPSNTRPKKGSPSNSIMNERFPYIETGRRSSTASSMRKSSHLPSFAGSGSSSSNSTPSGKVYSDFSAPGTSRKSKRGSNIRLKESGSPGVGADKENLKENLTPLLTEKVKHPSGVGSLTPRYMGRPKSLQTLPGSAWICTPSSLANYTTSDSDFKSKQLQTGGSPTTPSKTQLCIGQISPVKLTTRPRSVFDLRSIKSTNPALSPAPVNPASNCSPRSRERYQQRTSMIPRKPITGPALEGDTLRMLLDPSWEASGPRLPVCTSSERHHPVLHLKASSSTLALNREPSPGAETRAIDTVLGYFEGEESKVGVAESCGRSVTPGQRMAERFLRERTVGSGRGNPVSILRNDVRSMTESPAFV